MAKILHEIKAFSTKNSLLLLTILGVSIGIAIGFSLRHAELSSDSVRLIAFPGEVLMRMLKILILPIFVSSIITGIAILDSKSSGKIGLVCIVYILVSTLLAAICGVSVGAIIKPGSFSNNIRETSLETIIDDPTLPTQLSTLDTILDLVRNIFPENIVQATLQHGKSKYHYTKQTIGNQTIINKKWSFEYDHNMNMLGIITYCIVFGLIVGLMKNENTENRTGITILDFFEDLSEVSMKMIRSVMLYAPIGIAFLIAGQILVVNDLASTAKSLGFYILTCVIGLLIHVTITIPVMYFVSTRKNPFKYYCGLTHALMTGFATSSSTATMPVIFECLEKNNKVDKKIIKFVIPVGTTINMNGTAVYQTVAAIFIAQLNGRELTLLELAIISVTATAASIGAASIPTSIVLSIVIVLQSVDIPLKDISLIFAVDFLVFAAIANILGNSTAAGVVDHICKKSLRSNESKASMNQKETMVQLEPLMNDEQQKKQIQL